MMKLQWLFCPAYRSEPWSTAGRFVPEVTKLKRLDVKAFSWSPACQRLPFNISGGLANMSPRAFCSNRSELLCAAELWSKERSAVFDVLLVYNPTPGLLCILRPVMLNFGSHTFNSTAILASSWDGCLRFNTDENISATCLWIVPMFCIDRSSPESEVNLNPLIFLKLTKRLTVKVFSKMCQCLSQDASMFPQHLTNNKSESQQQTNIVMTEARQEKTAK